VSDNPQCVCSDTSQRFPPPINPFIFNRGRLVAALHFFPAQAVGNWGGAMATAKQLGLWAAAAMAAIVAAHAACAADQQTAKQAAENIPAAVQTAAKREIVVSLEDRKLALVENGQVVRIYPVAVGKSSTPSPVGSFTIARRVENPTYQHDGKTVPPGPGNPVGTRWMGLSDKAHKIHGGYGIHGTNEPRSIGKAASHGCIRMAKADLEDLYRQVQVGDTVELIGHRDEETARLLGGEQNPDSANQPVLAANPAPAPAAQTQMAAKIATPIETPASAVAAASGILVQGGVEVATAAILTGAL
jgi:lipoprotein-anchoring transpeptidase ErfK/SrfK